jgi:hypothetical protein
MSGVVGLKGSVSAGHPVFVISREGEMSDLSRIAAASLLVATVALLPMATSAEAQRFIPDIIISSTVPANGDLNPYGVAFVPPNFPNGGIIAAGDILVSNFNNSTPPTGIQGTGTTIIQLTPNGVIAPAGTASTFFTSSPSAIGLTTALGVLERGFVVVGNLPNSGSSTTPKLGAGSLQFIDRRGRLVGAFANSLIDGPWDLTIDDDSDHPTVYVSNVLNGTVVRLNLTLTNTTVTVNQTTKIAAGYTTQPSSAALVLGPTGLTHDTVKDTLYVASTADNAIFAVPNASTVSPANPGTGMMIAQNGQLRGPLALAFAPNGDLITSNGDAVPSADPNHPSEIVELTKAGTFVGQFNVNSAQGGAFGLAIALVGSNTARLAAVDDNTNEIVIIDQNVVPGG